MAEESRPSPDLEEDDPKVRGPQRTEICWAGHTGAEATSPNLARLHPPSRSAPAQASLVASPQPAELGNSCRPASRSGASPPIQTTLALGSQPRHAHLHLASPLTQINAQRDRPSESSPRRRGTASPPSFAPPPGANWKKPRRK